MNHSQHMSSSCTSFSCYHMRFHNWECNSKEGKRPRSYLIERSFTVGPGHSLELGLGPFDWAANRNARKRGPRLDWRDERKKKGTRPSLMFVERKSRWNSAGLRVGGRYAASALCCNPKNLQRSVDGTGLVVGAIHYSAVSAHHTCKLRSVAIKFVNGDGHGFEIVPDCSELGT